VYGGRSGGALKPVPFQLLNLFMTDIIAGLVMNSGFLWHLVDSFELNQAIASWDEHSTTNLSWIESNLQNPAQFIRNSAQLIINKLKWLSNSNNSKNKNHNKQNFSLWVAQTRKQKRIEEEGMRKMNWDF
jgi:hypothetical protein